jgi:DNA 3'-phosphatase
VSNQGGISLKPDPKTIKSDQKRLADFKAKVSAVLTQLDIPISVYAATSRDLYRKPRTGMWRELLDDYDLDASESVDHEKSFFVGDAGGREAVPGGGVKDHSCVDRFVATIDFCISYIGIADFVPGISQLMSAYLSTHLKSSFYMKSQDRSPGSLTHFYT